MMEARVSPRDCPGAEEAATCARRKARGIDMVVVIPVVRREKGGRGGKECE